MQVTITQNNTLSFNPKVSTQELSKEQIRAIVAKRAAKEFKEGDVVTLGIGLPTAVADYVPESMHVIFQSENGVLGVGKTKTSG